MEVPVISVVAPPQSSTELEGPNSFRLAGEEFISLQPAPEAEPGATVLDRVVVSAARVAAAAAPPSRLFGGSTPVFGEVHLTSAPDAVADDTGLDLPPIRLDVHSRVVDALLRR